MLQATTSEGLAQGSYVEAKVGFESATLRTQATELTTEPQRPTNNGLQPLVKQRHSQSGWDVCIARKPALE